MSRIIKLRIQLNSIDGESVPPEFSRDQVNLNKVLNDAARQMLAARIRSKGGKLPRKAKKEAFSTIRYIIINHVEKSIEESNGEIIG